MGLPTKVDMVCFSPVGYALTKGYLKLETSAKHRIPQAKNIPYQPLLIKSIFSKITFDCNTMR